MHPDPLSTTFSALADPTRRGILARLATGEATVTQLAAPFDMTLPAISRHLKVLQRAGLVEQGRQAQWRPCRLRVEPLRDVAAWMDQYRRFLEERLDRLDAYLAEIQQETAGHGTGAQQHGRESQPPETRQRPEIQRRTNGRQSRPGHKETDR